MFSSQETPITRLDASRGIRPNRLQLVGAVEVAEAKEEPAEKSNQPSEGVTPYQ
ncbi:unnamed protein product, partial [Nesidiocoris tenuis]